MFKPVVTIIIPTYKDWARLTLCIDALEKQTYPAELIQVIIVNNATDSTPDNYYIPANCTIISEHKPGSYSARNAGLKLAKGEIIGFTDSDCIPLPDWIESVVSVFATNPDIDRVGGRVELFFAGAEPLPIELYDTIYSFRQEENAAYGASVTANMFTRKKVFDEVGAFNSELFSSGDVEWGVRANKAGFKLKYADNVVVKHPARDSLTQMIKKTRRLASGKWKRNKPGYVQEIFGMIYKLRPKKAEWKKIARNGQHLSFAQRLKVFGIKWYLDSVRVFEGLRLLNGGKPYNDV
ncbi:glycosyltransferase family 2 protein [Mucilaginibacter hurinus]|uniref:Glycosyltransferase family 2 protein n=1 Tax=Mucilaginibacter hurinus TaxID=2201324 RepID=A0A367GTF2_9SPHI|nr:glycosyltransferase [Mucilaginibacter hurinus]RCH56649.1 glycosyltransferase family 2 protein [Mucilaginibacter hurinus]